jgi:hypothetical protein
MIRKFFSHVIPGVIKPLKVIWNQMIGFTFLVFAVFSGRSIYKSVVNFNGDGESIFRLALTSIFALLMTFFGLASFLRARRISRS